MFGPVLKQTLLKMGSNVINMGANVGPMFKQTLFYDGVQCCQHWPMLGAMFGQHTASQGGGWGGGENNGNTRWVKTNA